jgi:hypothetical protein
VETYRFLRELKRALQKNSWYLMMSLRAQLDVPWICVGDFNEVLIGDEHFGVNDQEA